ncbi:MAG: Guanylate kinase, partial [Acidobacteria bacterium]|nr:Guanylate kinase [Acidobacteriota bacterium]
TVEEALAAGAVAVFDIDVQGGAQILDRWPGDAVSVLVLPPSPEELERRLRGRSTESDEAIRLRLAAARTEVARAAVRYGYVIVNDRLEDALERLSAISRAARARRAGSSDPGAAAIAGACRMERADLSAWGA